MNIEFKNFDQNEEDEDEIKNFFIRIEKNGYKEVFNAFMTDVIYQYALRFDYKNHIISSPKNKIFKELDDPINFFINKEDQYYNFINFIDDFELEIVYDLLYSILFCLKSKEVYENDEDDDFFFDDEDEN